MSVSLTVYIQVSCFLMQNVASQYPPMFGLPSMAGLPAMPGMPGVPGMPGMPGIPGMPGMPGIPGMPRMPQIIPYQSPVQSAQFYNTAFHSNHRHKHKRNSKKNKLHRRHKHRRRDMLSSSESSSTSSESEDTSGQECSCDLTCDQCSTETNNCCDAFCGSCMNQGVIFFPVPYPVVMTNQQSPKQETKEDKGDKHKETKNKSDNDEVEKEGKNNDGKEDGRRSGKLTVNATDSFEERSNKNYSKRETVTTVKFSKEDLMKSSEEYLHNAENSTENSRNISYGDTITRTLKRRVAKIFVKQKNENEINANAIKVLLDSPKISNPSENYFKDIIFKVPNNGNTKYVLTSMRRVKENWLPKYGIVPIPENVATDLMTNLRSLKSIQSLRETHMMTSQQASKKVIQRAQDPGSSQSAVAHKTNYLPQKLETILVHDTGSGMTIEGPKSAIQSLNRKILENMRSEKNTEYQTADALPIDLVNKIYQY